MLLQFSLLRSGLANILAVLLIAAFPGRVANSQYAQAKGEKIVDAKGDEIHLRGINLGNWLVPEGYMWQFGGHVQSAREIEGLVTELIGPVRARVFWHTWRDTYVTRGDIHLIGETGFNSIRVPIHYKFFASDDAEGFQLIDRLVQWSKAENIYLVLDMHAAPGGQTGTNIDDSNGYPWLFSDTSAQQEFLDTWQRIAHHYRNEPTILGYDMLNEPIPNYPRLMPLNSLLEPLYKRVSAAVRKEDRHHILILGGAQWDNNFGVFGPPFDPNIVYEWHRYRVENPDQTVVQPYVDFRQRNHVPIWLGEAGENNDDWIATFRTTLEKNDIGWAFWPYKKMGSSSTVETIAPPEGWSSIVEYAKQPDGAGLAKDRLLQRPDQTVVDRAFAGLLENIQLSHCTMNIGYVRALLPASKLSPPLGAP